MRHQLLFANMTGVEIHVRFARNLHLVVDGTGHYVAWRKTLTGVVFLHKLHPVLVLEYGSGSAHGLGDEERRRLARIVERGGMELHKLHILDAAACAVHHSHAVAGGGDGVGGGFIDVAQSAGGQNGGLGKVGVDGLGVAVEDVGTIALYVGGVFGHTHAEVVLGDEVDGVLVFLEGDVGVVVHGVEQAAFYLGTGVVLMVEDAELRVSALAVQVVVRAVLVELHAPLYQLFHSFGGLGDGHTHHRLVADAVAGHKGVGDVFLVSVGVVHHGGDTALGVFCGTFGGVGFGKDAHFAVTGHLKGVAKSGNTRTNYQKINFIAHILTLLLCLNKT